jgi:DNA topoisomerase VI subunit A
MAKKKKDFTGDPGGLIGDTIFSVIKPIYKEGEKQRRVRTYRPRRTYYAPEPKTSQKLIVFQKLPQAIRNAGTTFNRRDLYYAIRPLCYAHYQWEEGKELNYTYFSQQLLTEYQEERGLIAGMWTEPRGHLHEPHTGNSVALGTREIAAYEFPEYTFDKILYVEKEGELPKLQAAKLAERYDMAVASAKGYPVEAVRELFSRAEGGNYQLFVFHDADIDGYNIARVMREATRRMPYHNVDVVDIGLTVEDALEMDLDSEPFSRTKSMPWALERRLSPEAEEYFVDRHERFELNAILPDTRRIEYIEEKLAEKGVRGKVIPPKEALKERREEMHRKKVEGWVDEIIAELLDTDELKKKMAEEFQARFKLQGAESWIKAGFKRDDAQSWRAVLNATLEAAYEAKHAQAMKEAVREYASEVVASEASEPGEADEGSEAEG